MIFVDSDVLVDVLRHHPAALQWFAGLSEFPAVSGYAVLEVFQGCRNARDVRAVQTIVRPLQIVWTEEANCVRALSVFPGLRLSDGISPMDALIAATAVGRDAVLYTFNAKHYRGFPGLTFVAPYQR